MQFIERNLEPVILAKRPVRSVDLGDRKKTDLDGSEIGQALTADDEKSNIECASKGKDDDCGDFFTKKSHRRMIYDRDLDILKYYGDTRSCSLLGINFYFKISLTRISEVSNKTGFLFLLKKQTLCVIPSSKLRDILQEIPFDYLLNNTILNFQVT